MKTKTLTLCAAMTLFVALTISIQTFAQNTQDQFTTFDAAPNARTLPQSINPSGEITGYYADASNSSLTHGFVRSADGTIATFDAPGAGPYGTFPASINPRGEITGYYFDASYIVRGFVREP
jgi:hypothetical protein